MKDPNVMIIHLPFWSQGGNYYVCSLKNRKVRMALKSLETLKEKSPDAKDIHEMTE